MVNSCPYRELVTPVRGRRLLQQALTRAERRLVVRVSTDRGIGLWRRQAELRLEAARRTFGRLGRIARCDAADIVIALTDQPTRDLYWLLVESEPDPAWPAFWLHLCGRALPPYRAEPLFLLAWSAWRRHDAALSRAAVAGALAADPAHGAAALLTVMLHGGVSPDRLPSLTRRPVGAGAP
jgi:hypothetical protein